MLSVFHKIMEKLMYKRLIEVLDKHNILTDNQFGFLSGRSTTHATMLITDKIQTAKRGHPAAMLKDLIFSCAALDLQIMISTVLYFAKSRLL